MLIKIRQSLKNQQGFTLVELLAVVAILGILAAIAIPRFTGATTTANTGKIAADLATIDSAVQLYSTATGTTVGAGNVPAALVPNYLAAIPTPPQSGKYFAGNVGEAGTEHNVLSGGTYRMSRVNGVIRATYRGYISDQIHQAP